MRLPRAQKTKAPAGSQMASKLLDWLSDLEQRGPAPIALGLDRVAAVDRSLCAMRSPDAQSQPLVFMVAGTNGKGSTVCYIDSVLRAAGLRCGRFTSPHLIDYRERISINGTDAEDAAIVGAFERIERARADIDLTYFEFGTLAALELFRDAQLDAWVLEVGLGGRLDAVNIVNADIAVITSIDIDHQQYLGGDREVIGLEKAGIMRSGCPVVLGDRQPPRSVIARAEQLQAPLLRSDQDFSIAEMDGSAAVLVWSAPDGNQYELPTPPLPGTHQRLNLAAAVTALWCARERWPFAIGVLRDGIAAARLRGRLQRLPAHCALYLDVAHNPDSARALADWLRSQAQSKRRIIAVFALLVDKDLDGVLQPLLPLIDEWSLADMNGPRARTAAQLQAHIETHVDATCSTHADVGDALRFALERAREADLVIAFGSFLVAEQVLKFAQRSADCTDEVHNR